MAYFKIMEPNKSPKYIKEIDRVNTKLKFSKNYKGCFQQDYGFFADSEAAYLRFHFMKEYPELKYMKIVDSWEEENGNGNDIQEFPNAIEEDAPENMEAANVNAFAEEILA